MSQYDPNRPPQPPFPPAPQPPGPPGQQPPPPYAPPGAPPFGPPTTPLGYTHQPPRSSGKKILLIVLAVVLVGGLLACGLLMSILVPSLNRAREQANRVKCATNLRMIGQGIQMYANENRGQYPDTFEKILSTQDLTSDVFVCTSTTDTAAPGPNPQAQAANLSKGGHLSYVYVGKGMNMETAAGMAPTTVVAYEPLTNHTNQGINVLFADGHVAFVPATQAKQLIADVQAGKNPPSVKGF
jgi:prepilin-type processing-associated H-X9-DG protein